MPALTKGMTLPIHLINQLKADMTYSIYARPQWKSRLNSKRPTLSELELLVHVTRLEF